MGFGSVGAGFDDQSIATGGVDVAVAGISASTEAILVLQSTGGTLTTDGTEQNLLIVNEPLGCFKPLTLYLDLDAMQVGDVIDVRAYYRLSDGGGLQQQAYYNYAGADGGLDDGNKVAAITLGPNRHGFRLTLQRTGGTDRAYPWEVFAEA